MMVLLGACLLSASPTYAGPEPLWQLKLGTAVNQPPLITPRKQVIVVDSRRIQAVDQATGALKWQYQAEADIWPRSVSQGIDVLYFGDRQHQMYSLDLADGTVQWVSQLQHDVVRAVTVGDGRLYATTSAMSSDGLLEPEHNTSAYALDPSNGEILWQTQTGCYAQQTPVALSPRVYLGCTFDDPRPVDEGGHLRLLALDAKTGRVDWQFESEDGFPKRLYAEGSTLAYVAYQDFIVGLDITNGQLRWRYNTGNWVPDMLGHDGVLYFGSANNQVHAVNLDGGGRMWSAKSGQGAFNYVLGAPALAADEIQIITQRGDWRRFNRLSGKLLGQNKTSHRSRTGLALGEGITVISSDHGGIYAYTWD